MQNQLNAQGNSTSGITPNAAALISYLFIPITSIIFLLMEKENRFVRFHAMQSLLFGATTVIISIALSIVLGVGLGAVGLASDALAGVLGLISLLLWLAMLIAFVGAWLLCVIKAYQGQEFKLPIVGALAKNMTNK